ncbi:MAG: hypothetical protein IPQ02_13765 [Saprospiraceae bacterium]|nr:hypothetical protein [Candidatus Defluviibacterium haderslevense]
MLSAFKWAFIIALGSLIISSCYCAKTKLGYVQLDLQQVTLQKIIPGESDQESYWQIKWNSTDTMFNVVYYNDYSGLINRSKDNTYSAYLHLDQHERNSKLKQLIKMHQLVFQLKHQKNEKYVVAENYIILDPVYLPSEKANE